MVSLPKPLAMLSPTLLLVGLIALLALRRIHYELTTGARRRRMIRDNGCEPPVMFEHQGVLGRWLGIDVIKEVMRTAKEGTLHEHSRARNFTGRNTLELRMLLSKVVFTTEPENIKTVLSTKFDDFELGPRRARTFVPVLGHGSRYRWQSLGTIESPDSPKFHPPPGGGPRYV